VQQDQPALQVQPGHKVFLEHLLHKALQVPLVLRAFLVNLLHKVQQVRLVPQELEQLEQQVPQA
jgi:hypothetical protein